MRPMLTTLLLSMSVALGQVARADEAAEFEAIPELPPAQVMCLGEAALPDMLRFAFQSEPEVSGRPDIIRVSDVRRAGRSAQAPRQAARQPGPPVLRLPCIRG